MRYNWKNILKLMPVALCLAGCGDDSSSVWQRIADLPDEPPAAEQVVPGPVRGRVLLDEPLVGAAITLETHDGQLLPGTGMTDEAGVFEIPVTEARHGLRVVAVGGSTSTGGTFRGSLSAYVEPFDADFDVFLTPVTTMADRLRILDGRSAAEAELRIANYLALEPGRSIGTDFRTLRDFNHGVFMNDAAAYGFDALVNSIVAEASTDPNAQRRFSIDFPQVTPLASHIGMELIKSAVSGAGSSFAGSVLAKIGLDGGATAVLSQLQAIRNQLNALQATVDGIARDVKQVKTALSSEIAKETISFVKTTWADLQNLEHLSGAQLERERLRIENFILTELAPRRAIISHMLNGELGADGSPIRLYAEYLRDSTTFYSIDHYNKFFNFVEFYDGLNTQLYYLVIEARNAQALRETGQRSGLVAPLEQEISAARARYRAFLPRELPKDWFIGHKTKRLWYATPYYDDRAWWGTYEWELRKEGQGTWSLPSLNTLAGDFSGGRQAVINRGVPAHLFQRDPVRAWAEKYSEAQYDRKTSIRAWEYFDISQNKRVEQTEFNPSYTTYAHFWVYRQLNDAQLKEWLPWL